MKDRNQENDPVSEPGPEDDYALRYGTQSFDDLPKEAPSEVLQSAHGSNPTLSSSPFESIDTPIEPQNQSPPRAAHDPYDGFDDYAQRHGPDNTSSDRYDGFAGYAQRHAIGNYRRDPLSHVRGAVVAVFTFGIFFAAFKVIMAYLMSQVRGEVGMGGLFFLGLAAIGAIIVTAIVVSILAVFINKK